MREESSQGFPRQNNAELVHVYIESGLKKAGINLQQYNIIDGTVTTDKKIPEEIMSNICRYAAYKNITIKFITPE
jgi:aerobic-type carbon monoxide dehydrogenase small subunit (CoxS/CutS family)